MTVLPPSVLPDISPTRGEINARHGLPRISKTGAGGSALHRLMSKRGEGNGAVLHPISPRVGEMVGRPEGGNSAHHGRNSA
jgi:hypothetical protein